MQKRARSVAPDLIVSAAHCMFLSGVECSETRFVFGYQADASGGSIPTTVPQQDVYSCTQFTEVYSPDFGEDWILYKLDRPVSNRVPLRVQYTREPALGTPLVVIGHPNNLPLKVSPAGTVTGTAETVEFQHNVDSFGGNSGSPVFDRDTGVVQGIHVAPPDGFNHFYNDADASGTCRAEQTCPATGCVPSSSPFTPVFSNATRITRLAHLIPLVPALTVVAIGATHWP